MNLAIMPIDATWFILMIPGLLLGIYAQMKLQATYSRYRQEPTDRGVSGAETARTILDRAGLQNVPVHEVPGHLTDHYDPTKRAVFLSSEVYHSHSVAALGVAAHETGHALQHQAAYKPMSLRMALVPITNFASNAAMWITGIGFFAGLAFLKPLLPFAIAAFAIVTFFHIVTLPVEFDASRRAREHLTRLGLITQREEGGVRRVLSAAAMTYVAAMLASVMQLLHLVLLARSDDDR